jgi:hypothetical protein
MQVYYVCRVFHRIHARILVYIFTDERVGYPCFTDGDRVQLLYSTVIHVSNICHE